MPCYKPLKVIITPSRTGGKSHITFPKRGYFAHGLPSGASPAALPCGQCIGCRLERSRQWAIRLMKELKLHDRASFLTLTYDDNHLPKTASGVPNLNLRDVQLFLKSLRKHFEPAQLRFFQCGEYGENTQRPHYHMVLFGEDFYKDRERIEDSPSGFPQYTSLTLTRLWGNGRATISEVSFESAAYVARYCLKKITGQKSSLHYKGRTPEFVTMSRRPGIGSQYFTDFKNDIYPHDEIIPGIGRPASLPPKYFDKLLEKADPELFKEIKKKRQKNLDYFNDKNNTDTRLATRERVKKQTIKNTLTRKI